jgi:hypothetical protein
MTMIEEDRERTSTDADLDTPDDPLLRREEAAAAREAGGIGGRKPEYEDEEGDPIDEADRALIEGGEGVEEGFETAESDLREAASQRGRRDSRRARPDRRHRDRPRPRSRHRRRPRRGPGDLTRPLISGGAPAARTTSTKGLSPGHLGVLGHLTA